MKIARIEDLHADRGGGAFSFLKVTTDDGLIGWSEYTEGSGSKGLTAVILGMTEQLIGRDPRPVQQIAQMLYQQVVQAPGGVNQRACAAIEAALWDVKAKALGVPVYELFGGPVRRTVPVYWSHCASYRIGNPAAGHLAPIATYDDIAALGAEVRQRGFRGLKTNVFKMRDGKLVRHMSGYGRTPGYLELTLDRETLAGIKGTLAAFREGAGPEMNLHLDTNFHFRSEGYIRVAQAIAEFDMTWLEMDMWDPGALADIRRASPVPIASAESVIGRRGFRCYLDAYAMDVGIVDILWNGWLESLKIASMVEAYELNVAPHNYHGHLASAIAGHFCAVVPNLRVMEIDIDGVPWRDELFVQQVKFEHGEYVIPTGPGWGVDVNEAAVRARAAR